MPIDFNGITLIGIAVAMVFIIGYAVGEWMTERRSHSKGDKK